MPSTYVSEKYAALTADGTADGLITLASNEDWLPGATLWLASATATSIEAIVVEQVGTTQLRLRNKTNKAQRGISDVSAFTVADSASVAMEGQIVPVMAPFVAAKKA